jgi:hypothetical protein
MITKRDLLVATLAAFLTRVGFTLAQSKKPLMASSAFDWNAIDARPTKTGTR